MNIYITQWHSINPAFPEKESDWAILPETPEAEIRLTCREPDTKAFITDPAIRRRMSRAVRMGTTVALQCLPNGENPDAILTATGLGCLGDTEKFLHLLLENNEELLNPTPFIQSTFNTVGAQIAMMLKNTNYNNTYVHRGCSFENALLDARMMLSSGEAKNVLAGSYEELTDCSFDIFSRLGFFRNGGKAGEGAQFFLLSTEEKSACRLKDIALAFNPSETGLQEKLLAFLHRNNLHPDDVDCLISGESGNKKEQAFYDDVEKNVPKASVMKFKHRVGDYQTVSSFALWLGAQILHTNTTPACWMKTDRRRETIHLLIYNHYRNRNHSFILLEKETGIN